LAHQVGGAGAGLVFISPLGVHMRYVIRLYFLASNNIAEYEGLINSLHITIEMGSSASMSEETRNSSLTK
jgi:ribonuclease HI